MRYIWATVTGICVLVGISALIFVIRIACLETEPVFNQFYLKEQVTLWIKWTFLILVFFVIILISFIKIIKK